MIKFQEAVDLSIKHRNQLIAQHKQEVEQYCDTEVTTAITNAIENGERSAYIPECPKYLHKDVIIYIRENGGYKEVAARLPYGIQIMW